MLSEGKTGCTLTITYAFMYSIPGSLQEEIEGKEG